jgi:hypothetical protein
LDVDNHTRRLGHEGVPYVFLHQTETRTRSCGHRFGTGPARANHSSNRRNFVFHLNHDAAESWEVAGQMLGNLAGRRDGITSEKPASCKQTGFSKSFTAL